MIPSQDLMRLLLTILLRRASTARQVHEMHEMVLSKWKQEGEDGLLMLAEMLLDDDALAEAHQEGLVHQGIIPAGLESPRRSMERARWSGPSPLSTRDRSRSRSPSSGRTPASTPHSATATDDSLDKDPISPAISTDKSDAVEILGDWQVPSSRPVSGERALVQVKRRPSSRRTRSFSRFGMPRYFNMHGDAGCVVFLHGAVSTRASMVAQTSGLRDTFPNVHFVFPSLPWRMWGQTADADAGRYVVHLVKREVARGTPIEKIVVAGFSEGGMLALRMLSALDRLGGVLALSARMPAASGTIVRRGMQSVPVFWGHGDADEVLCISSARHGSNRLATAGANVEFKEYPGMGHTLGNRMQQDARTFLERIF